MNLRKITSLWFTVLFSAFVASPAFAQRAMKVRFVADQQPLLVQNADTSVLGFAGGLQSPYFGNIDLDNDGVEELVAWDVFNDRKMVYQRSGTAGNYHYILQKDLEEVLPRMAAFSLFLDVDGDGLTDVVTGEDKLRVFFNASSDSVRFSAPGKVLKYQTPDGDEPIVFQIGEQPTMADIDGDGRPDVLVFDNNGQRVIYYRNISKGKSLLFEEVTTKWGFFIENGLNFDISLGAAKKAHPGSRLLALDQNGDGDVDLFVSDLSSPNAYFLENGRADNNLKVDSMVTLYTEYPVNNPIEITYFPSFSLADVNFDGEKDLICSNTSSSPVLNGLVWLYTNGPQPYYDFELSNKYFLQDQMIDLGASASPAVFDYDGDGDEDLLVAGVNHLSDNVFSLQVVGLSLYINTPANGRAVFTLADDDFLQLKNDEYGLLNPHFGDIDNDGVADLLLGTDKGEIYYYKNNAKAGAAFNFSTNATKIEGLDVGTNAAPCLFDVDGDGINDLIVGELSGNLNYYKGGAGVTFTLKTENWGHVKTNTFYYTYTKDGNGNIIDSTKNYLSVGGSHPTIGDIDNDGKTDLMVGSAWGKMYFYPAIDVNATYFIPDAFWYHNQYYNANFAKDLGEYIKPVFCDLNGDGKTDLLTGTFNGGLEVFGTDSVMVGVAEVPAVQRNISLFPNPSQSLVHIRNESNFPTEITVYNMQGKLVEKRQLMAAQTATMAFNSGIYLLSARSGGKVETFKFVVN
ncbi:T9SS type A sorting domain-containing protein [bacterium]|nr:T9SS type A sorting domain-containing protein [bacterium]